MTSFIVFDLDGTLVDSRRDLAESANALLSSYSSAPLGVAEISDMVGEGARVLVERVLAARQLGHPLDEALGRFLELYEERVAEHTRPYPGVLEMLGVLRQKVPLAVLTNKPSRHTHLLLDALELSRFFLAVQGFDGTWPRKPDPTALLRLVALAGTTPARTMMVGDSPVDAETARKAGTQFCALHYGIGKFSPDVVLPAGTRHVHRPTDLGGVLAETLAPANTDLTGPV